jgi:DNA-binding beta-propeller fold protein YncE
MAPLTTRESDESNRLTRRRAAVVPLAIAGLLLAAATALAVTGQLTQLSGTAGCVSNNGSGGACADGKALFNAYSVAVSPDGKNVYAVSNSGIAVFARNTTTGRLGQLPGTAGCLSETGSDGACGVARPLSAQRSVAVSPDGKNVYVASLGRSAVLVFQRNQTSGALTQLPGDSGCVSQSGFNCADGRALGGADEVVVSPDGKSVYVLSKPTGATAPRDAVAVFQRNTTTGALTQLAGAAGCVRQGGGGGCRVGRALDGPLAAAVSPDGKSVYVASDVSDAVAVLRRNTSTGALFQPTGPGGCVSETGSGGTCADGKALDGAGGVVVSADGENVYAASRASDAVAVFKRETSTGALSQLVGPTGRAGCISETGSAGACVDGRALDTANAVASSGDRNNLYVTSLAGDAVAVFRRDTTTGALAQLAGQAGCVSESGSGGVCADGKALDQAAEAAVSADGRNVYVAAFLSHAVAVFAREPAPSP